MASLKSMLKKVEVNSATKGLVGVAMDAGVGFGASYAIGRIYHRYGDKWAGRNVARLAGGVGLAGAVACAVASHGHQTFVGNVLHAVGMAGVNAVGLDLGLRHERAKSGKRAVLVPTAAALPAGGSEVSAIGALGRAGAGRGLTWDQVAELAAQR